MATVAGETIGSEMTNKALLNKLKKFAKRKCKGKERGSVMRYFEELTTGKDRTVSIEIAQRIISGHKWSEYKIGTDYCWEMDNNFIPISFVKITDEIINKARLLTQNPLVVKAMLGVTGKIQFNPELAEIEVVDTYAEFGKQLEVK